MKIQILIFAILVFRAHELKANLSKEKKLKDSILNKNIYSNENRPVFNMSTSTIVSISLTIIQIIDIDEVNQIMNSMVQISFSWLDEYLTWDPLEFSNQTHLIISSKEIWVPDIVLFNSADQIYSSNRDNYLIKIQSNGLVTWTFPDILKSYCKVNIKYFPFDRQKCKLEFQSWSREKSEIIVKANDIKAFSNYSFIQTEWDLTKMDNKSGEDNGFVWLEYSLWLKRNEVYNESSSIFYYYPFIIALVFVIFFQMKYQRIFSITILLALTVFLQTITQYTPKASEKLPLIGLYFNINLILVLISVVLTIVVLNFHFRGPQKQRVPKWMRKYVIERVGRLICLNSETKTYKQIVNNEFLKNVSIIKQQKTKNNEFNDYIDNTNEPVYLKKKELTKIYSDNQYLDSICNIGKSSSENFLNLKSSKKPFGFEMINNFEEILIKIQNSFNSFEIKDEHLKFSLLKEILECQNLLLEYNLSSKKKKSKTKDEIELNVIYDEWKLLAIIVDRICFIFYLLSLIISSLCFILSEQDIIET